MTELFFLYLFLKLDTILGVLTLIVFLSGIAGVMGTVAYYFSEMHIRPKGIRVHVWQVKWVKAIVSVWLGLGVITTLLPNAQQAAILAAGYYTSEALASEEGQKLIKVLRLKATKYLDEQLEGSK